MIDDIKTIVYASDLINYDAKNVFATAVKHSMAHGAKLVFLNVVEPIDSSTRLYLSSYLSDAQLDRICSDQAGAVRSEIESRIRMFCEEELSGESNFDANDIEIEVVYGKPDEMIVDVADKKQADMIVMGTRVHSKLGEFIHHSVAHHVMIHAKCPVLISHIR